MTTAIMLAGGSGTRMGMNIPKQFVEVNGKPILIYTLEQFESHNLIDSIVIVCITGWESVVHEYIQRFNFTKVSSVLPGGSSAIESIKIGLSAINGDPDDIVLIHESVRPLVEGRMITDVIEKCKEYGAAMSATPLREHIFFHQDSDNLLTGYYPRWNAYKSSSPHAYTYRILTEAFKQIELLGESYKTAFSSTMMIDVHTPIAIAYGSDTNIKITTREDIALFKALLDNSHEKD